MLGESGIKRNSVTAIRFWVKIATLHTRNRFKEIYYRRQHSIYLLKPVGTANALRLSMAL